MAAPGRARSAVGRGWSVAAAVLVFLLVLSLPATAWVHKRDELVSRAKVAQARVRVQQAVQNVSVLDPTSELSRFEERVRREEAMAEGMEEVSRDASHDPFAQLAAEEDDREVESRFARLKSGGAANG